MNWGLSFAKSFFRSGRRERERERDKGRNTYVYIYMFIHMYSFIHVCIHSYLSVWRRTGRLLFGVAQGDRVGGFVSPWLPGFRP